MRGVIPFANDGLFLVPNCEVEKQLIPGAELYLVESSWGDFAWGRRRPRRARSTPACSTLSPARNDCCGLVRSAAVRRRLLIFAVVLAGGCGGQETAQAPQATRPPETSTAVVPAQTSPLVTGTQATEAQLAAPEALAFDAAGNLDISDFEGTVVVKVDAAGTLTTIATELSGPAGLAFDSRGDLFVADHYNNRIRRIDPTGAVTTVAGTGTDSSSGDGGPALAAELNDPIGIAFDSERSLYVADEQSARPQDRHRRRDHGRGRWGRG